jgi:diacylglycerol kinase family enzyme
MIIPDIRSRDSRLLHMRLYLAALAPLFLDAIDLLDSGEVEMAIIASNFEGSDLFINVSHIGIDATSDGPSGSS